MPASKEFRTLKARVSKLRRHFLPEKLSPTGSYTERQCDRVLGYRLLVHAEIEHYVESIALAKIREKVKEWKKKRKGSDVILCFLASYHRSWNIEDLSEIEPLPVPKGKDSVEAIIDFVMVKYKHLIDSNHGIKEDNLRKVLMPIGIRFDELDDTWLKSIDSYGGKRGEAAHKAIGAQQLPDPKSEMDHVNALLVGLEKLDQLVRNLK